MISMGSAIRQVPSRPHVSNWMIRAAVAAAIGGTLISPAYAADAAAAPEELEEVTVTGSRIMRTRDLESPSPVVTVSTETFENTSTTSLESTLNKLPQFAPAGSQFVSGAQPGPTSTPGAATLNLRGIGANRNLVLIDGRRPQPANASLVVDINTIPQAAVQGVEVITGGASAVYGPDAIAGVTNFLLKKNFEGLSLDVQTGITEKGDGQDTRVSALLGMNGADGRGNIMIGLDYSKRGAVFQRDRDFFVDGWRDTRNAGGDFIQRAGYVSTGAAPSQTAVNTVLPTAGVAPTSIFYFNTDGSAFVAQNAIGYTGPYGQITPAGGGSRIIDRDDMMTLQTSGLLDQRYTTAHLSTPSERHSLFLKGHLDINDNLTAFAQANFVNSEVLTRGNYAPAVTLWSVSIPRDDIIHTGRTAVGSAGAIAPNTAVRRTLPGELVTLLDSRTRNAGTTAAPNIVSAANEPWQLYQVLSYFGALESINTSNVWQMQVGLNGKMGISDWTWESYFAHGITKTDAEIPMPSLQRYQLLAAAPNFGANATGSAAIVGPANPGGRGYTLTCTSGLPVFQEFDPSADCIKSMEIRGKQLTTLKQDVFEANMQGHAFDLPAGEARFAAGFAYRKNSFRFDPSYPVEMVLDNPVGLFASNSTSGSTNVRELYGELLAPVLPGFELELGYRLSDFNTAGKESTYKAMFTWKALDQLSFRGGYQLATRAPNTAELFAGNRLEVVTFPGVDPCSAATDHLWGNRAENANRTQVQAICRSMVNRTRGLPANDMTSLYDTQTFNTSVVVNGRLMGPGANGFTRQNPPYFPLEIETEAGNPNLDPETAKTITLGAVLTEPLGINGLTATMDAYQIRIEDTISRLSSFTAYYNCLNANGGNPTYDINNEFCLLIDRNGVTGDRENVDSLFFNLGKLRTRGIDVALNWRGNVGPGSLSVGTSVNYLLQYKYQPDQTAPFRDAKGTLDQGGQYDYRALTTVGYSMGAWDFGVQWRFLPRVDAADKALLPGTTVLGTGAYSLFNLTGGLDLGKVQVRGGVDNVLNRRLPIVGANYAVGDSNSNQTNLSYYDGLGRRYFVGVKLTL